MDKLSAQAQKKVTAILKNKGTNASRRQKPKAK